MTETWQRAGLWIGGIGSSGALGALFVMTRPDDPLLISIFFILVFLCGASWCTLLLWYGMRRVGIGDIPLRLGVIGGALITVLTVLQWYRALTWITAALCIAGALVWALRSVMIVKE